MCGRTADRSRCRCGTGKLQPCRCAALAHSCGAIVEMQRWMDQAKRDVCLPMFGEHKADPPITQWSRTHVLASDVCEVITDRGHLPVIWLSTQHCRAASVYDLSQSSASTFIPLHPTGNRTLFRAVRLQPADHDHFIGKGDLPRSYQLRRQHV
jgi:hypothetical protein